MKILGIETSCDETAAAVVEDGIKVLSNVIATSVDLHKKTGGVVPEVAAREHIRQISPVVDCALEESGTRWDDIDAIAVTYAPGLVASLLIGVNTAQTLSYIHKKPLIPVHHIAGHIYANFLEREKPIQFPILVLTVSGGHNELVLLKDHYDFEVIGETLDDAAGEAFDKVARMLDIGFPGGPAVAKAALKGNPTAYDFPRAYLDKKNKSGRSRPADKYNFSFSGLKTAVRTAIINAGPQMKNVKCEMINDIAASFQMAVADVLSDKLVSAAEEFGVKEVHLAGGVSANQLLREITRKKLDKNIELVFPKKLIYCTDNAAMIAGSAYFLSQKYPKRMGDFKGVQVYSQYPLN
jgi:N6-L-threonylcarbamoyladenine synthase